MDIIFKRGFFFAFSSLFLIVMLVNKVVLIFGIVIVSISSCRIIRVDILNRYFWSYRNARIGFIAHKLSVFKTQGFLIITKFVRPRFKFFNRQRRSIFYELFRINNQLPLTPKIIWHQVGAHGSFYIKTVSHRILYHCKIGFTTRNIWSRCLLIAHGNIEIKLIAHLHFQLVELNSFS